MKNYFLKMGICIALFYGLSGCGYIEGDYEIISEKELTKVGIDIPFPSGWDGYRDADGNWVYPNDILRDEGYTFEQRYGQIIKVRKGQMKFSFSTRLKRTYLSEQHIIFTDGNRGIEDGFFRYFLMPIYSRLNTFDRETFELIDQRVIHGRVQYVIIIDEYVYFHVADYSGEGIYGRYKLSK